MVDYILKRSRRKTVALHVTKDARLEVRAPYHLPKKEIDNIINTKERWINEHLQKRIWINMKKSSFSLNYGDSILLMGKEYVIEEVDGDRIRYDNRSFKVPAGLSSDLIKQNIIRLYKTIAESVLTEKTSLFMEKMNVEAAAIKINSAKTRWGSCSSQNSINYSWRLIMASDDIIDYVVVHELAHIIEPNHSDRFWSIVEQIIPDYRERHFELRQLQERISTEDWD